MILYLVYGSYRENYNTAYLSAIETKEDKARAAIKDIVFFNVEWDELHPETKKNLLLIQPIQQEEIADIDEAGIYAVDILDIDDKLFKSYNDGCQMGRTYLADEDARQRTYEGWVC